MGPSVPENERLFAAHQIAAMFLIMAFAAVVCQYYGFNSLMVYDEAYFIKSKEAVFAEHDILRLTGIVPVRPLFLLTFYLNYLVSGMEPFWFRVVNAIILALSGLALTILAALVFELPRMGVVGTRQTRRAASFLLGMLFVVHPLQCYVVLYAWQREAIMACLFYFSALAAYVATRSGRISNRFCGYIITSVLFLLGMLSKENVATLPLSMVLAEFTLFRQSFRETCRRSLTILAFIAPAAMAYWAITQMLHRSDSELVRGVFARLVDHYDQGGLSFFEVCLTEARVFFSYLSMMLFPLAKNMEFMRAETVSRSLVDPPGTLAALAGLSAILAGALALVRIRPIIAFGLLFMLVSLAPESLLIPQYLFFGYRAILPMAGLLLAMGDAMIVLADRVKRRIPFPAMSRGLVVVAVMAVASVAALTATQAKRWNHISFWTDLVDRVPPYSRNVETVPFLDITVNCMSTMASEQKYTEAIDLFRRLLARDTAAGSVSRPSDDISQDIARFMETFRGQNMRLGGALISLGIALQSSGRTQDAILAYSKAVAIEPHHTDVQLSLGALLEDSGNLSDAISRYRQAIAVDPGSAIARNCLGNALKKAGDVQGAIQEYSQATQVAPNETAGYLNLGVAFHEQGLYKEAAAEYAKALTVAPQSAEAHHKLGRAMAESGNLTEALDHYRKAVSLDPGLAIVHGDLGLALEYLGRIPEAVDEYSLAVKCDPNSPAYYVLLGHGLTSAGRLREAIDTLTRATELAPDLAVAFQNLGIAWERSGNRQTALEMLRKTSELDPSTTGIYSDLGRVLLRSGNVSEAVEKLRTAIELNPSDATAHVNMGRALERINQTVLAQDHFRTAVQLRPDSLEANYRLANNMLKAGQALEAVEVYSRVLKLKPDMADAHANMALALLHAGKIPEAIVTLGRALSIKGENAQIFYALGRAFAEMKQDGEAAKYLEKAAKLNANPEGEMDPDVGDRQ